MTEEAEERFWELEAKRLLASAGIDEPLVFGGRKVLDKDSAGGYRGLSEIADQVHCNLHVVQYDNQVIAIEHCDEYFGENQFLRSQRIIEDRLSSAEPQKNPRKLNEDNSQVHHALIDYITSIIARILVRSINSESLHTHGIMVLAKFSTKLKVLSMQPVINAEISLESGQHTMRRIESAEIIRDMNVLNRPDTEDDWDAFQHNNDAKSWNQREM
ncbi:hypothetical protein Daus18300_012727 [Diaporthe australafricana]|uniref:Uncharacterized protein n=1 Tax=Diaporthe australafricana TaxID=127596 RepID=A0ABR3W203_9PEZI